MIKQSTKMHLEKRDTKHSTAKRENAHSTARWADWDDDNDHRDSQKYKVDGMDTWKEDGRKKEPESQEDDRLLREEGSYRDRSSTSILKESGLARGKDNISSSLKTVKKFRAPVNHG
eukprot:c43901_g1_i1 orf=269-619(-)